jgi:hypothetical protein
VLPVEGGETWPWSSASKATSETSCLLCGDGCFEIATKKRIPG